MNNDARILVVDDKQSFRFMVKGYLSDAGHEVTCAANAEEALQELARISYDLVVSDIVMPQIDGVELLRRVRKLWPQIPFILITAHGSIENAVAAMKEGAYDYISKPFKVDEIRVGVEKAIEKKLLATENRRLKSELRSRGQRRSIIGTSAPIQRVLDFVSQVADTKANVLISGESGTGKEVVARAIHAGGDRRDLPFVASTAAPFPRTCSSRSSSGT